jgi:hypothetical protein
VDEWRVVAQKKVCVLCNLARHVQPVPVMSIGNVPHVASGSPSVASGTSPVPIGVGVASVTPAASTVLSDADLIIWWDENKDKKSRDM